MDLCNDCTYGTCMCDCEDCGMLRIDCACPESTHPSYREVEIPLRSQPAQYEFEKVLMQNHYGQVANEN